MKKAQFKKARSLKDIAVDPRVDEVWSEGEDGYWVKLKSPWWSTLGTTQVHEWTVKELLKQFNWIEEGPDHDHWVEEVKG